jgi:plasmid maintenance system killer protein
MLVPMSGAITDVCGKSGLKVVPVATCGIILLTLSVNIFFTRHFLDITFASAKLQKTCNNERKLVKQYGIDRARRLRRRLDDLRAAETLEDMRYIPGRCHELKGDRAGQLSLDLDHPYRLIFSPAHDPVPCKSDGGLDWTHVSAVIILGVEDTHQ